MEIPYQVGPLGMFHSKKCLPIVSFSNFPAEPSEQKIMRVKDKNSHHSTAKLVEIKILNSKKANNNIVIIVQFLVGTYNSNPLPYHSDTIQPYDKNFSYLPTLLGRRHIRPSLTTTS